MYTTMLVFENQTLLEKLKNLPVWGQISDFKIETIVNNGTAAYKEMQYHHYDLIIAQIDLNGMSGLQLLNHAKHEKLCEHVVLYSDNLDYNSARQSIILGAYDYFVGSFESNMLYSVFSRIKNELYKDKSAEIYYAEELLDFFVKHNSGIDNYIDTMMNKIYATSSDILNANEKIHEIYKTIVDEIFEHNGWLDLYIEQHSFDIAEKLNTKDRYSFKDIFRTKLEELFTTYCELYPKVNNAKIQEILLFILDNPESNLKQKSIAANMYINSSSLSTIFAAQTGDRFVDYLTKVKLRRAGILLKHTMLPINEIAARLDYKDTGYFSRLFKKFYGMTPSEYRMPDGYDYQI